MRPDKSSQNRRSYLQRKQTDGTITVDERSELKRLQGASKSANLLSVAKASNAATMQGARALSKQATKSVWKDFAERLRVIAGGGKAT